MTTVAARPVAVADEARPSPARLVWLQARYATTGFWRTPVAAFFTLVFPLMFLLLIGLLAGNEILDARSGIRLAQFLTPAMAVFGAASAAFTTLAISVAFDRDLGILKRLRGTPMPAWAYVAGRIASAAWVALLSVTLLVAVGVAFYGVEVVWSKLPAALVTLVVGIGCMAALGLAVVALAPSAAAVQVATNGLLIPLAFISGIFSFDVQLPGWLDAIATALPLKHFVEALADTFNPFHPGSGFAWDHLAVIAAWTLAGALVAVTRFRWEPGRARPARSRGTDAPATAPVAEPAPVAAAQVRSASVFPRPTAVQSTVAQVRYATSVFWRDRAAALFTVLFPVGLLLLLPQVFGRGEVPGTGIDLVQFLAPVMAVYGIASASYATLADLLATARDKGILKRVHGTPVPVGAVVAGRIGAAVGASAVAFATTVLVGVVVYRIDVVWSKLPALVVTVLLGMACFAALGVLLASVARSARSVPVLANATLLPLAFVSDIFLIGDLPRWLDAIGWAFPLKHLANAVADAFNPTLPGLGWQLDHLAVLAAWFVVAVVLAARWFSWQPRHEG